VTVELDMRNESTRSSMCPLDELSCLAERVCDGEGLEAEKAEVSLLLCDDGRIQEINRTYRNMDEPTDVLSFEQDGPGGPVHALGDIVISLETIERRAHGDDGAMRADFRLVFCHGLLHLLGYDHDSEEDEREMSEKQAHYLNVPLDEAWPAEAGPGASRSRRL